jgi:SNF2 family DNA or RNA helicase
MSLKILIVCPQAVGAAWVKQIDLFNSGVTPWEHQQDAASWVSQRQASALLMDMGTGKSLTALMACGIVGKVHALQLTSGVTKRRGELLTSAMVCRKQDNIAVITNYDAVYRPGLASPVESVKWDVIILDESHRIKSPMGRASKWLAALARKNPDARLLCLTGTPLPHSPLDAWAQFRFLNPAVFGASFVRFRARYARCDRMFPSKVREWLNQSELTAKIDSHSWRVTADEVLDLPDSLHETIPVTLSTATARVYGEIASNMTTEIEAGTITAANALTRLLRLQQCTSGYGRLDGIAGPPVLIDGVPSKRLALMDWLEDIHVTEPVVVFCRFRCDLDEVAAAARELGRPYSELSGEANDLANWQNGNTTILGVQLQSGGVGIDLTRAAYAVYYSMGFSLGDYTQSLARLRRPGQTRCVRYYHLVAGGTVDEQVYTALKERRDVVDAVLEKLSPRKESVA